MTVMRRMAHEEQAYKGEHTHEALRASVRVSRGQSAGKFETHTRPGTKLQLPADAERATSPDTGLRGVPSPPLLDESSAEWRRDGVLSKDVFLKYPGSCEASSMCWICTRAHQPTSDEKITVPPRNHYTPANPPYRTDWCSWTPYPAARARCT